MPLRDTSHGHLDEIVAGFTASFAAGLGRHIAAGISDGIAESFQATAALPRPETTVTACLVPGCSRGAATRGVCKAHYGKTLRQGFNDETFNEDQLGTLAADGRKRRYSGNVG